MAIKTSKTAEMRFASYKTSKTQETNRLKKLLALQKAQPNNKQIATALDNIGYRRCTPKTEVWSHQMIAIAKMMKEFAGKFDKAMFSPDPKLAHSGAMARNPNKFLSQVPKAVLYAEAKARKSEPGMFSIATRLACK